MIKHDQRSATSSDYSTVYEDPLMVAIHSNDPSKLQPLSVADHPYAFKLLKIASTIGAHNSIRFLLKHNRYSPIALYEILTNIPPPSFDSKLFIIALNIGLIDQLTYKCQHYLLTHAINHNQTEFLKLLLIMGVDFKRLSNENRMTLMFALETDKEIDAILLLAAGAVLPDYSIECSSGMSELVTAVRRSTNYKGMHIDYMLTNTRRNILEPMRNKLAEATIAEYGFNPLPLDSRLSLLPSDIWEYYILPYLNLSRPTFNPSLS